MALKFKSIKTNRDSTISNDTIESMYIKPLQMNRVKLIMTLLDQVCRVEY